MVFNYEYSIDFDVGIMEERRIIIQILSNYILYDTEGIIFIYSIWIIVSLIPIILLFNVRRATIHNLIAFFFPNFFFYVFLSRYSPVFFNANYADLIMKTIVLGIIIVLVSILLSLLVKLTKNLKKDTSERDLELIADQIRLECPKCGTKYESIPIYCYNCNCQLKNEAGDKLGK